MWLAKYSLRRRLQFATVNKRAIEAVLSLNSIVKFICLYNAHCCGQFRGIYSETLDWSNMITLIVRSNSMNK